MNYLDTYKNFKRLNKNFVVEFYKEYEGDGGYWDERDTWVSGKTIHEQVYKETFKTLESALKYADSMQDEILNKEKERIKNSEYYAKYYKDSDYYWISDFKCKITNNACTLITAEINWGGSNYKMKLDVVLYK